MFGSVLLLQPPKKDDVSFAGRVQGAASALGELWSDSVDGVLWLLGSGRPPIVECGAAALWLPSMMEPCSASTGLCLSSAAIPLAIGEVPPPRNEMIMQRQAKVGILQTCFPGCFANSMLVALSGAQSYLKQVTLSVGSGAPRGLAMLGSDDPGEPLLIETFLSENGPDEPGSSSKAPLRIPPGLSDETQRGPSDARDPQDRGWNEPDLPPDVQGAFWRCLRCDFVDYEAEGWGGWGGWRCRNCGSRSFYNSASPTRRESEMGTWVYMPRQPQEYDASSRSSSSTATTSRATRSGPRTLPTRQRRAAAAAAPAAGRDSAEVTKAGAAMDGRDSRKGPAQGIRYRSGMPPAPATRHYSDDLRAYDRWEKRVRIWFVSLNGEAEEELENADLQKINHKKGIEFILETLRNALKTRTIYQKRKYMHDFEQVSGFSNEGVRAFCNRYHRVERALQACGTDIEPMYDSEARGARLLERLRLSPEQRRMILIGAPWVVYTKEFDVHNRQDRQDARPEAKAAGKTKDKTNFKRLPPEGASKTHNTFVTEATNDLFLRSSIPISLLLVTIPGVVPEVRLSPRGPKKSLAKVFFSITSWHLGADNWRNPPGGPCFAQGRLMKVEPATTGTNTFD
eukprot:s616_g22.t1